MCEEGVACAPAEGGSDLEAAAEEGGVGETQWVLAPHPQDLALG